MNNLLIDDQNCFFKKRVAKMSIISYQWKKPKPAELTQIGDVLRLEPISISHNLFAKTEKTLAFCVTRIDDDPFNHRI
jgi:hypothetical protein